MNIAYDARYLFTVWRALGTRAAWRVYVRGLRGDSAFCWLVTAVIVSGIIGLVTAEWAVVPRW